MGGDWGELALVSRAEQWVASNPYFFVVSTATCRLLFVPLMLAHERRTRCAHRSDRAPDGRLDRTARRIELRGNLFPAHTLNSALGKIPFIGEFLVGGEDQGIFGIAFRVSGNLDKPDVQVNPLTALAPVRM